MDSTTQTMEGKTMKDETMQQTAAEMQPETQETQKSNVVPFPENPQQPTKQAPPSKEELKAQKKEELFSICESLARNPRILDALEIDMRNSGVVGESKIVKLLYLALTTRLFDRPVSVAVKGPSAGGKSFLVDNILGFFPSSAYYQLSSMSPKAIVYTKEEFINRFIVFAEAEGMPESSEYLFRTLLSENQLKHEVSVQRENGSWETDVHEKKGPTGLILTTTRTNLHPENETRIISVTVVDTREQTQEVLLQIANEDWQEVDVKRWMALQEYIALDSPNVKIPYAGKLASLTVADALRMKRDFKALINLIKAHALLHQHNREKDEQGNIIAALEDYAIVKEIVGLFIAEAVESAVPNTIRETVQAVQTLLSQNPGQEDMFRGSEPYYVQLQDIASKLVLDPSSAARRVRAACEAGYLVNLEARLGRPAKIRLGNPLPEDQEVLPSVERLQTPENY